MESGDDVDEGFPPVLNYKSRNRTREIDSESSSEEELFATTPGLNPATTPDIDLDSDVEEVIPTALSYKSRTTPRESSSEGALKAGLATVKNPKGAITLEINLDSDVEEVIPTAPNSRPTATPEIDSGSDAEAVCPDVNLQTALTADGKRLFRIRRTVLEMLRDRGYRVSDAELLQSPEQFAACFGGEPARENMKFCAAKMSNAPDRILVIFAKPTDKNTVGKPTIIECAAAMPANATSRAILVVQKPLTPMAKQCIDTLDTSLKLEVFQESELLVNLTKSVFVPKHHILAPEEKQALMKKYKIPLGKQQMPMLRQTDPVARYLGLEKGQVIRIIRPDDSVAGHQATYRIVT